MIEVVNPANAQVIAELPAGDAASVDTAVRAASLAAPAWAAVTPGDRGRMLRRIASCIDAHRDELVELEISNAGKTRRDAVGEVEDACDVFEYFSGAPERLLGMTVPVTGGLAFTVHEPIGVVGVITAWNSPLILLARKLAPALAAGNVVVHKPSELTPLSALLMESIVQEAGVAEGVFQVLVGTGEAVGEPLVEHPGVGKICFTGSTAVGEQIASRAGSMIKQVALELGGKSVNVVFADSDIASVAAQAAPAVFGSAGQDCCARSRILVQQEAFDDFLAALEPAVQATRVGDPGDPDTDIGPLISSRQRDRVAAFVDDGAPAAITGSAPTGAGFWFPPTVLAPVDNDARVAQEEIFGPVASVIPFRDEEHALQIANDSRYGLAGSIWTSCGARGLRMARGLQAGNISINSHLSVRATTPFGGMKRSGLGRELGPKAVHDFTETKTVFVSTAEPQV